MNKNTDTPSQATGKTDYTHGSQSKPVVLTATFFIAALGLACLYLAFRGPDKDSVFFFLRHAVFFYPLMIAGVFVFARISIVGFKRVKTM